MRIVAGAAVKDRDIGLEYGVNGMTHTLIDAARQAASETPAGTIFEMVPTAKLFLDNAYGRHLSEANLRRLRSGWSVLKMGTLYASLRPDGRYAVIDGWHRKTVAEEHLIEALPCYVYLDLTIADEAALYEAFGTVFTQSPMVKFKARLVSGDPVAVGVDRVVHEAGLRISYASHNVIGVNRNPNDVLGIVAIESIYRGYGRDHLKRVLWQARNWFPGEAEAMREVVLRAVHNFLVQYVIDPQSRTPFDVARMDLKCSSEGIKLILRRAQSIRVDERLSMHAAIGRAMRAVYNQGLAKDSPRRLPEWRDNIFSPQATESLRQSRRRSAGKPGKTTKNSRSRHVVFTPDEIAGMPD